MNNVYLRKKKIIHFPRASSIYSFFLAFQLFFFSSRFFVAVAKVLKNYRIQNSPKDLSNGLTFLDLIFKNSNFWPEKSELWKLLTKKVKKFESKKRDFVESATFWPTHLCLHWCLLQILWLKNVDMVAILNVLDSQIRLTTKSVNA